MATLDETNIFGLTPNQPEKKDDSLSRLGISESGYPFDTVVLSVLFEKKFNNENGNI